jgi:hypothetical protein
MLFNLSCCRNYPSKNPKVAIKSASGVGPSFLGGDFYELSAMIEPFNGDK